MLNSVIRLAGWPIYLIWWHRNLLRLHDMLWLFKEEILLDSKGSAFVKLLEPKECKKGVGLQSKGDAAFRIQDDTSSLRCKNCTNFAVVYHLKLLQTQQNQILKAVRKSHRLP